MVKEIQISNGMVTLVDNEDYEILSKYKWHISGGYAINNIYINGKRTTRKMHQLLIKPPKGFEIDHINRDKLNNRRNNLRIVTHYQNTMNKLKPKNSTSKYKGVSWHKQSMKWRSRIRINNKQYHLGLFINEIDAAKAYNERAENLHGEDAYLNEI